MQKKLAVFSTSSRGTDYYCEDSDCKNKQTKFNTDHVLLIFRIVAKIEPEKGTKIRRKNYKQPLTERLQTLLDKHAVWQNQVMNENENLNDEDDDMGDP